MIWLHEFLFGMLAVFTHALAMWLGWELGKLSWKGAEWVLVKARTSVATPSVE